MTPIKDLGGYVPIRNNFRLGYCAVEAVESLLKICSEVVVCDSDSTDGTLEEFQRMADKDSRIKIVNFPWTNPKGVGADFLVEWLNFARQHLTTKLQITLDADEILDDSPECHEAIRQACESENPARAPLRLNYWKDVFHLIPEGNCCSPTPTRLGLQRMRMSSDQGTKFGEFEINEVRTIDRRIKIHHVGFIRRSDLFYQKSKVVQKIWINGYDERLTKSEQEGKPQWDIENCEWTNRLDANTTPVPLLVQKWLISQGQNAPDMLAKAIELPPVAITVIEPKAEQEPLNILHSGDFGDIIYGMSVMKSIGKVRLYFHDTNWICKRILDRLHIIEPLLRSQDYILECKRHEGEPINWDAFDFRSQHTNVNTLAEAHASHYATRRLSMIEWSDREPWIKVDRDPRGKGRVIINRTMRYRNEYFPWRRVLSHYKNRLAFIGDESEYEDFCKSFGPVDRLESKDLLDAAKLIAACDLFIGNQSAPFALAVAMGIPAIQESYLMRPDCIFDRDNIQYVSDKGVFLPDVRGSGASLVPKNGPELTMTSINMAMVPPKGWCYPGLPPMNHFDAQKGLVKKLEKCDSPEAERLLLQFNLDRVPEFFMPPQETGQHAMFVVAYYNAFKKQPEAPKKP